MYCRLMNAQSSKGSSKGHSTKYICMHLYIHACQKCISDSNKTSLCVGYIPFTVCIMQHGGMHAGFIQLVYSSCCVHDSLTGALTAPGTAADCQDVCGLEGSTSQHRVTTESTHPPHHPRQHPRFAGLDTHGGSDDTQPPYHDCHTQVFLDEY